MKKEYKKPEIVFESFKFNAAIAECSWAPVGDAGPIEPGQENTWTGGVDDGSGTGIILLNRGIVGSVCHTDYECYHLPTANGMASFS